MVTRDAWRVEAPDLIKTELEKRPPAECKIVSVEPDSFYHEEEEVRYVNVLFKGAHPYGDFHRINAINHDIRMMLRERGYDPVPGIDFLPEGTNLV